MKQQDLPAHISMGNSNTALLHQATSTAFDRENVQKHEKESQMETKGKTLSFMLHHLVNIWKVWKVSIPTSVLQIGQSLKLLGVKLLKSISSYLPSIGSKSTSWNILEPMNPMMFLTWKTPISNLFWMSISSNRSFLYLKSVWTRPSSSCSLSHPPGSGCQSATKPWAWKVHWRDLPGPKRLSVFFWWISARSTSSWELFV